MRIKDVCLNFRLRLRIVLVSEGWFHNPGSTVTGLDGKQVAFCFFATGGDKLGCLTRRSSVKVGIFCSLVCDSQPEIA